MKSTKLMIEAARRRLDELDSGRVAEADRGEFADDPRLSRTDLHRLEKLASAAGRTHLHAAIMSTADAILSGHGKRAGRLDSGESESIDGASMRSSAP